MTNISSLAALIEQRGDMSPMKINYQNPESLLSCYKSLIDFVKCSVMRYISLNCLGYKANLAVLTNWVVQANAALKKQSEVRRIEQNMAQVLRDIKKTFHQLAHLQKLSIEVGSGKKIPENMSLFSSSQSISSKAENRIPDSRILQQKSQNITTPIVKDPVSAQVATLNQKQTSPCRLSTIEKKLQKIKKVVQEDLKREQKNYEIFQLQKLMAREKPNKQHQDSEGDSSHSEKDCSEQKGTTNIPLAKFKTPKKLKQEIQSLQIDKELLLEKIRTKKKALISQCQSEVQNYGLRKTAYQELLAWQSDPHSLHSDDLRKIYIRFRQTQGSQKHGQQISEITRMLGSYYDQNKNKLV